MNTLSPMMKPVFLIFFLLMGSKIIFREAFSSEWGRIIYLSASSMLVGMMLMILIIEKKYKRLIISGIVLVILILFAIIISNR